MRKACARSVAFVLLCSLIMVVQFCNGVNYR